MSPAKVAVFILKLISLGAVLFSFFAAVQPLFVPIPPVEFPGFGAAEFRRKPRRHCRSRAHGLYRSRDGILRPGVFDQRGNPRAGSALLLAARHEARRD